MFALNIYVYLSNFTIYALRLIYKLYIYIYINLEIYTTK
jgi:hypothetical protein